MLREFGRAFGRLKPLIKFTTSSGELPRIRYQLNKIWRSNIFRWMIPVRCVIIILNLYCIVSGFVPMLNRFGGQRSHLLICILGSIGVFSIYWMTWCKTAQAIMWLCFPPLRRVYGSDRIDLGRIKKLGHCMKLVIELKVWLWRFWKQTNISATQARDW